MGNLTDFISDTMTDVNDKKIVKGSIILNSDDGEFYYDTLSGERVLIANSITYLNTDDERINLANPKELVLYVITATKLIWIYAESSWICLNSDTTSYFDINNIEVPIGDKGIIIFDNRIKSNCYASFHSIPALYDLANNSDVSTTCTCFDGSVKVVTTCNYPLIGNLNIIKP